jgi:hypothetical protein
MGSDGAEQKRLTVLARTGSNFSQSVEIMKLCVTMETRCLVLHDCKLCRFYLKTETDSSLRNVVCF